MTETYKASENYCNVKEQKHLVSRMTECDHYNTDHKKTVECYIKATKESRENNACMYS